MNPSPFDALMTGTLSSQVVWERSHRCPCISPEGEVDRSCQICGGAGRYFDPPSAIFRAGVVSVTAKALAYMQQTMGPGVVGECTISVPGVAPCWSTIGEGDRITVIGILDQIQWTLSVRDKVRLPFGAVGLAATKRSPDGTKILAVTPPTPDADGKVSVSVPTVLSFRAPRRFEVVRDLAQNRAFGCGLPKKFMLKRIDWSVR